MLKFKELSMSFQNPYGDENVLFRNLNLQIKKGEFVCIIGSNGTGKSTLLNITSGLLKESSGEIYLDDMCITSLEEHRRTSIISRVFQDPSLGTCPSMTVRENLSMALNKGRLLNLKRCLRHKEDYLVEILKDISLDLKNFMDVKVKFLSGGQRQAVSLIMASVSEPKVLLLDEHTAALDPKTSHEIMELTQKIVREKKITTMMVTHNLSHALKYGDRLIMLHKGSIIMDLSRDEKERMSIEDILEKFEYAL